MIREYTKPPPIDDILVEHSEEAAFMYESRCLCLEDPELSWQDLRGYDQRMMPHLRGLVLGGFVAANLLKDKLTLKEDEEPGEAFVTAIVYSMLELVEPMQWLIEALGQDPPHLKAIVDGLKFSESPGLEGWLEHFLQHENPIVRAVGAEVTGYRRCDNLKEELLSLRNDLDQHVSMAAAYALVEVGIKPDENTLMSYLNTKDPTDVIAAVELLLKMGASSAINHCRGKCVTASPVVKETLIYYLAISGTVDDCKIINQLMVEEPSSKKDCLLALGLCGNANSVDVLITCLGSVDDYELFTAAIQGLRLITGIDHLPQFDPDEVEPKQVIEYQAFWKNWWDNNRSNFASNIKWRRGKMISPGGLYNELLRQGNHCRHMTYLEMVIRYGCTVDFQFDRSFDVQLRQLHEIHGWVQQKHSLYKQGISYYNGVPLA